MRTILYIYIYRERERKKERERERGNNLYLQGIYIFIFFLDLWGPSGDHHAKKLSILVIFNRSMSFLAKNTFSKCLNVIFHQDFSPKAAADQQQNLLIQIWETILEFIWGLIWETILIEIFPLRSVKLLPFQAEIA